MSDDLERFKQTFITESFELLEEMESMLLALDESAPETNDLHAIFRCAHSIKGSAGAFGFTEITNFTHILEELLDAMREERLPVTRNCIDALIDSVDIVRKMIEAANANEAVPPNLGDDVVEKLNAAVGKESISSLDLDVAAVEEAEEIRQEEAEVNLYEISFKPHQNLFQTGNEPLSMLRELAQLGDALVEIDTRSIPPLPEIQTDLCYVSWFISLETEHSEADIREVFEFVEDECDLSVIKIAGFIKQESSETGEVAANSEETDIETQPEVPPAQEQKADEAPQAKPIKAPPAVSSIRVDVGKVDRLVNMVGELVITQAMITAQTRTLSPDHYAELLSGIQQLSQHCVELQEMVMSIRMQPVKSIFARMPRIVRDLCNKLDKDIRLETYGEGTELDKTVIEQLADPLTHMIRNSVDHGIEANAQERTQAGKSAQGVIKLSAAHRGGKIIITIEDDGAGINREKVLQKARDKRLVAANTELSPKEIDDLVFMPGFSTADAVSDISGRGVGMDVVRKNIEGLGGTVCLNNYPGKGAMFEVMLPLTLAILDGMIVRVGSELYVVPITNIIETLRPRKEDIHKIADANDSINFRGEFIQMLYLHDIFGIQGGIQEADKALVIVVENGNTKFGLVVDELIGQQQVVIKSLEENSMPVLGISAATILGDGKVSLILDIANLQQVLIHKHQHIPLAVNG